MVLPYLTTLAHTFGISDLIENSVDPELPADQDWHCFFNLMMNLY